MVNKGHNCNAATRWIEQPPKSPHRYRVECSMCGKYLKWGTESQLEAANAAGTIARIVKFSPPATLDAFLDEEEGSIGTEDAKPTESDDDEPPF